MVGVCSDTTAQQGCSESHIQGKSSKSVRANVYSPRGQLWLEPKADFVYSAQNRLHLGNKRASEALPDTKASSCCEIAQACTLATDRGLRKRCTLSMTSSFDDSHSGSVSKRPCMARAAVRDVGLHQHSAKVLCCMNRIADDEGQTMKDSTY